MASSRSRLSIRASVRLATLAHAISRMSPVVPSRMINIGRALLVSSVSTSAVRAWNPVRSGR